MSDDAIIKAQQRVLTEIVRKIEEIEKRLTALELKDPGRNCIDDDDMIQN